MNDKKGKIVACVIFALYISVLLKLAIFRPGFLEHGFFTNGILNVVPFATYLKILRAHRYLYMVYQFGGNIAWFIPFGFMLPYLPGRPRTMKLILLFGFLLSFIIELSQFAFGTGVSELDDLILNTFGTFIGFQAFRWYTHAKARKK